MDSMQNADANWSVSRKMLFRFICVYVLMYAFSHPFGFPFDDFIEKYYNLLWDGLVLWVGKYLFGTEITVRPAGSGDTTFNYIQVFSMLVLSVAICLLWTAVDRKRNHYNTLFYWLTVFVRYYLACVMLVYGFIKIIKLQFPFPFFTKLIQPYGDSSPMGLLWTFLGYSTSYTFFAGLGEVVTGMFLFFRRTTTLGALIGIGVIGNVVMMNFSYDVPVKLFSLHLLVLALLVLATDFRRVVNVFVLNRPAPAADLTTPITNSKLNRARVVLKIGFIGFVLFTQISSALEGQRKWGSKRPKPALYGLYHVETYVQNGDTLAPLITDPVRWQKVAVDWPGFVGIQRMNDKVDRYAFRSDTSKQTITMFAFSDTTQKYLLEYEQPTPDALRIDGVLQGDTLSIHIKKIDPNDFLLVSRKFHWVSEFPFNR